MTKRPLLHFTAAAGWINDPLALTWRDGTYHLFFQYVPATTVWAFGCHWGHATSPDLLRWTEQPVALSPGDGDDGCWSGSLVTLDGRDAVLFYTSVRGPDLDLGRVRRARPADQAWRHWIKEGVVVEAPRDEGVIRFRDPFVFRDRDAWRMLVGATRADGTAVAFGYRSTDLLDWRSTGPLAQRSGSITEPVWTGTLWECVQLLPVDDRHLLVVSVYDAGVLHYVACAVGTYAEGAFQPENWFRLTYGAALYATSAYRDDRGRPGLVGWLRGVADPGGGWTGAITAPALVGLDERHHPLVRPHPNVAARRRDAQPARWPAGAAVDLEWSPRHGSLSIVDGQDRAVAEIRASDGMLTLVVDGVGTWDMPWPGGEVRLLLDGPVLEIFGGGALMAAPLNPNHQRVRASGTHRYWVLGTS